MENSKSRIFTNLPQITQIKIKKIYLFLFLIVILIKFFFIVFPGHFKDLFLHQNWANFLIKNPVTEIYTKTNCNLPPFWVYILWFFSKIHFLITGKTISVYSEVLKIPAVLADIFIGLTIFIFLIKEKIKEEKAFLASILFLLNPFILYNSSIWGQLDSIYVFFALLSFVSLYFKKIIPSSIFLTLSFLTKLQGIIFFPLFFFLLFKNYPLKKIIHSFLAIFAVTFIILLPFLIKGISPYSIFEKTWLTSWKISPILSTNAFNLWWIPQIILSLPNLSFVSENLSFFGPITFKMVGLILFSLFYLLILLKIKKNVFFLAGLVAILFFMVPTAMHERYIIPFFAFFSILWPEEKKYFTPYLYLSITSFLNLLYVVPPSFFSLKSQWIIQNFLGELSIVISLVNIAIFLYLFFLLIKERNNEGNSHCSANL